MWSVNLISISQVENLEVELDSVELDKLIEKGKEILNCIDSSRERQAPVTK